MIHRPPPNASSLRATARARAHDTRRIAQLGMLVVAVALAMLVVVPGRAQAIEPVVPDIKIGDVDASKFPDNRVAFAINDPGNQIPKIVLSENDQPIGAVNVHRGKLGHNENHPNNVVYLVLDASGTMTGAKFLQAKLAARELIDKSGEGDRIGIISYGRSAELVQEPTDDAIKLSAALDAIQITYGTATFDAVKLAADNFPSDSTRRMIVLLGDGEERKGTVSFDEALAAAKKHQVEIYSVGIEGGGVFLPENLIKFSNATGGHYQAVSGTDQLSQVYAELGQELLSSYWLEYRSTQAAGQPVKLVLTAPGYDDAVHSYASRAAQAAGGTFHLTPPVVAKESKPVIPLPGGIVGMLFAAFPFGLILALLLWRILDRRSRPKLRERIEPYTKPPTMRIEQANTAKGKAAFLAPLFRATDSVLGRTKMFARFRRLLEQANLPLREVELLYMMLAGLAIGGAFGLLLGGPLMLVIMGPTGGLFPYGWVRFKAALRKKAFDDQLADVLSTIAASLKAGHSFNQSINAVIKETPNPTSEELQRVMTETRLGMPLEEALEAMSARMGSVDFEFAVITVNIQRTVGGSLSEIIEMVGDTVRGRQQFRKKVKALTGMGRMSAYVLLAMPLFIAGILTLINREYMSPLFHTQIGHYLMYAGAFFMTLGYVACMKIVNIKV